MSCCKDNRKFNCGGLKQPAACVYYYGYFPKYSKLDEDCATVEEIIEELYKNQEYILKSIDTSKLTDGCLTYPTTEIEGEDKILVVDVLQVMQEEICNLKENTSGGNCDCIDISDLDMKCLADEPCYNPSNLNDILQAMIDKICELDTRITQLEMS